jgi:hypothetical protein
LKEVSHDHHHPVQGPQLPPRGWLYCCVHLPELLLVHHGPAHFPHQQLLVCGCLVHVLSCVLEPMLLLMASAWLAHLLYWLLLASTP